MSQVATQRPGTDGGTQRAVAIIPARLGSTRLPRKMLLRETGRYLFEHTVRGLEAGGAVRRVVLATDSQEIVDAAAEVGIEARMTDPAHKSGTDRVHEAYQGLVSDEGATYDVVVNVQGDEPDVAAGDLARLVGAFAEPEVELASLWTELDPGDADTESAVKVVLDAHGDALYFSRSPIPNAAHRRDGADGPAVPYRRHVGVYAFRPEALARFCALPEGQLERLESLEQLRWLEAGRRLRLLRAEHAPRGIDTPEDYRAFVARLGTSSTQSPAT